MGLTKRTHASTFENANRFAGALAELAETNFRLARPKRAKSPRRMTPKLGSRFKAPADLGFVWSKLAALYWCRESSVDLNSGLAVSEIPADTLPDDLRNELFQR